jgi:hypothetical protein
MSGSVRPAPSAALFAPGERLGWVFRDRNLYRRRYPQTAPAEPEIPKDLPERVQKSRGRLVKGIAITLFVTLATVLVVEAIGAFPLGTYDRSWVGPTALGAVVVCAAVVVGFLWGHLRLKSSTARASVSYRQRLTEWEAHKAAFDRDERLRCAGLIEWGAAATLPGTRRLDVVGGTLWGWEAFLTVYGTSMLGTRGPLTLVDLTGDAVCRELVELAAGMGVPTDVQVFPAGLVTSDLLAGLDASQFVDVVVEALYGDTDAAERANRMMDYRILTKICTALGGHISLARVAAAVRLLMGEPGDAGLLSEEEHRVIADELFSDEYRSEARAHLRRIEAFIGPLDAVGARAQVRPATYFTCLATVTEGRSAANELLNDLIVQWMMRRVASTASSVRTLVVAGADELQRRHIERLSDLCERRDVRVTFLFRHLREASLQVLGGGAVAFMRLGNHEEATRAADFIGRHHKFVLSDVTRTLGGNETHTTGTTDSYTEGEGGTRDFAEFLPSAGNWNKSRTWGTSESYAVGTNWTESTGKERVYEYAVEPQTLQGLPDYAMLLVQSQRGGPVLAAVECNPDIVTLPRVTMGPLPDLPLPDVAQVPGQHPVQEIAVSGFQHQRSLEDPEEAPELRDPREPRGGPHP